MCSESRNAACKGRGALRQGCGRGSVLKPGRGAAGGACLNQTWTAFYPRLLP